MYVFIGNPLVSLICSLALVANATSNLLKHDPKFIVVELDPSSDPKALEKAYNFKLKDDLPILSNHHVYELPTHHQNVLKFVKEINDHKLDKKSDKHGLAKSIKSLNHQHYSKVYKRMSLPIFNRFKNKSLMEEDPYTMERRYFKIRNDFNITDPGLEKQWHISSPFKKGNDLNVLPVWDKGYTGKGVTVAFIDDGLDFKGGEFIKKYVPEASFDFNDDVPTPNPKLTEDYHGTRCAGEVGAAKNNECGVGVAYDSKVAGIRALSKPILTFREASAMSFRSDLIDIYSCSWGPKDDGKSMGAPHRIVQKALRKSIATGRGGKGPIYVFASGNGGFSDDNCNFDGYVNSIYTIAVGAIDYLNNSPKYSEGCSGLMLVTYSGNDRGINPIYTADNNNKCTSQHSGTSAAGPLVAGVMALALEARPELTWRDIQHLIVASSVPIQTGHDSWDTTFSKRKYSNTFGYGKMDADKFVTNALSHNLVNPQTKLVIENIQVNAILPEDDEGITSQTTITQEQVASSHFLTLEHITVTLNITHSSRKDVEVELISPSGIISNLVKSRKHDTSKRGFPGWTVMSVKHWNEPILGTWTLRVKDIHHHNHHLGKFISWKINFFGQSDSPDFKAPENYDDDSKDEPLLTQIDDDEDEEPHTSSNPKQLLKSLFHKL